MGILTSRKYAPRRPRREPSKRVTVASLSALTVVAAGLSGLALFSQNGGGNTTGGNSGGVGTSAAASSEQSSPDSDETSKKGDGDAKAAADSAVQSNRLLAVSDDPERLVRAEGVECGSGAATVEVSSDGGVTWNSADTSLLELSGVRQLLFGEGGRVQLAYVDDACALQFARSYVYGGAWEAGPGAGGIWTLGPDEASSGVVIGGSEVEAPCTVVDISGSSDSGVVLCDDSTVSVSEDAGATWSEAVAVEGAQAVTAAADGYKIVGLNTEDCNGLNIVSSHGTSVGDPGECAEGEFDADQVAVSAGAGSLYVWVGELVLRSDDGGDTWN